MKLFLLFIFTVCGLAVRAQKVDSIYVNLYTDSLKKGTYNYINVDGLMSDGYYQPLDSTHIIFSSNFGSFHGNSLFLPIDFNEPKVHIKVAYRGNKAMCKEWDMYIKKAVDGPLKTQEELLSEMRKKQ